MKTIRLYLRLVGISFSSQMQYKASFFMLTIAHFLSTFVDIFGIWVLFDRFKMIQGWTLPELAILYSIMQMGFAAAESTARAFDNFGQLIKRGDFDRVLLRPLGSLFQVAASEIQLMRLGRFFQGLTVLLWACNSLDITFFSYQTSVIIFSIAGTGCLFYGLMVLQATLSFWTTETLELMNITTYGGLETGQYPMSIYKWPLRAFFTFIIPLSCVAFYPMSALLKQETTYSWIGIAGPSLGIIFLLLSFKFWKLGVRHYHSTGS